jgi:hypothetical protein
LLCCVWNRAATCICENWCWITIRTLTLRAKYFSVASDRSFIEWQADEGFIGPDEPALAVYETIQGIMLDPDTGHMMPNPHDSFFTTRRENLGNGLYRMHAPEGTLHREDVITGMSLMLYKRLGPMGFDIQACEWIDCEEVIVQAAPQFACYIESSWGVSSAPLRPHAASRLSRRPQRRWLSLPIQPLRAVL